MFKPYCFKDGDECRYEVHEESDLVFVLMPFAEEFDDVYQAVKDVWQGLGRVTVRDQYAVLGLYETVKGVWQGLGLRCLRSDEIFHTREIMCVSICQNIQRAQFIVADVTGKDPNVFYELGIAHILGKPIVLITQRPEDVPFDLRAMPYIHYGNDDRTADIPNLKRNLSKIATGLLESEKPIPLPIFTSPSDLTRFARLPKSIVWEREGKEMVLVPAGESLMGTSQEQLAELKRRYKWDHEWMRRETPQRRVYVEDFYIDKYLVTNAEYERFVEATSHVTEAEIEGWGWVWEESLKKVEGADWRHPGGPESTIEDRMDHPVVMVSWNDASAYADWVGKRLPTEAEWEKAARGTQGWLWPWGNEWDGRKANTIEAGPHTVTPVGSYPAGASPYGCLDMAGNVWEWMADWLKAYPASDYLDNDLGEKYKVLRGGSWNGYGDVTRCAFRVRFDPSNRGNDIGFRCVY
jgi:formylglycine-generating enzyme required for sulfatase activity